MAVIPESVSEPELGPVPVPDTSINSLYGGHPQSPEQQQQRLMTRRDFLNLMRIGVVVIGLNTVFPSNTAHANGQPSQKPLPPPPPHPPHSPPIPEAIDLLPRKKRIIAMIQHLLENKEFPHPNFPLHLKGRLPEEGSSFLAGPDFGNYNNGKYIQFGTGKSAHKLLTHKPQHLQELGVKTSIHDLVSLAYERYKEILKNPIFELGKTFDPTVQDFYKITEEISQLTGFPEGVLRALWWREMHGMGTYPEIHGGDDMLHKDGPYAPAWHFYSTGNVEFNNPQRIKPHSNNKLSNRLKTGLGTLFTFPIDNRQKRYRETHDLIVTHIPVEISRIDPKLNILCGLVLFEQAAQYVENDPIINAHYRTYLETAREKLSKRYNVPEHLIPDDYLYWGFVYSIYHHGGIPAQNNHPIEYYEEPAFLFVGTMLSKSWENQLYIGRSKNPIDEKENLPDLFFYINPSVYYRPELLILPNAYVELVRDLHNRFKYETLRINPNSPAHESTITTGMSYIYALGFLTILSDYRSFNYISEIVLNRYDPSKVQDILDCIILFVSAINELPNDKIYNYPQIKPDESLQEYLVRLATENPLFNLLYQPSARNSPEFFKIIQQLAIAAYRITNGGHMKYTEREIIPEFGPDAPLLLFNTLFPKKTDLKPKLTNHGHPILK